MKRLIPSLPSATTVCAESGMKLSNLISGSKTSSPVAKLPCSQSRHTCRTSSRFSCDIAPQYLGPR